MASNKTLVPEAKKALEQFKMEAANEVGVNLTQGYNGDLTSRQAGSVGGQMVKNIKISIKSNAVSFFMTTPPLYKLLFICPFCCRFRFCMTSA